MYMTVHSPSRKVHVPIYLVHCIYPIVDVAVLCREKNDDCMCIHVNKVQREYEYMMRELKKYISSVQHGYQWNVQQKRGISSHKVYKNFSNTSWSDLEMYINVMYIYQTHSVFKGIQDQLWSERTDAEILFKDEHTLEISDSVWPADTNRRIPTGSLHLSKVDLFDATT
jgi:hypothetical protein